MNNITGNPGDVTGDGHVTIEDLNALLTFYCDPIAHTGACSGALRYQGELNTGGTSAGIVDVFDLSTLLTYYGS